MKTDADADALDLQLIRAAALLTGSAARRGLTVAIRTGRRTTTVRATPEDVHRAAGAEAVAEPGVSPPLAPEWARAAFFSDDEAAILRALGDGELSAAGIAHRIGSELTTRLRVILANLADRHVLHSGTAGYRVADARVLSLIP